MSAEATRTVRAILTLREDHRRHINDQLGRTAANGHRVLDYLYAHPIVSVRDVQTLTGTTYPAANDVVAALVGIGVLEEVTGRARNRRFSYQSYIDLFSEGSTQ